MNILAACSFATVSLDELDEKLQNELRKTFGLDEDDTGILLSEEEIEKYDLYDAVDNDSWEFNNNLLEDILITSIGKYPHYLVFASGCRWNGASGYKFCDKITDTIYRDYDITLELEEKLEGRAIKCRESSHDVPMGNPTYIIGLSNKEYDRLEEASFEEVEKFAKSIFN